MQKKIVRISLLLTVLALSIMLPILVVTAKKQEWNSGPVYINDAIPGFTWEDWSAKPWLKGAGTEEDPYMIKDLVIDGHESTFCMAIEGSTAYFKIMKCTFLNSGIEGVRSAALVLLGTQNGEVFKNEFLNNIGSAIALIGSEHNLIHKNLCSENGVGIYNEWGMFNTIKQNDCKNNFDSGIVIASAHKTIIEKNYCTGNGEAGIALITLNEENTPKDNLIYANKVDNNNLGIYLANADKNDIFRNTVSQNYIGIMFSSGSEENTVYHNNIIENAIQTIDYQPGMNNWYHPYMEEGNYWSDYTGIDENEDGIGDTPRGYDTYPFMDKNGWNFMTPIEEEIMSVMFDPEPNRLGAGRIVDSSETSYLILGAGQLFSERVNGEWSPPYTIRVWFYGVEVFIQGDLWYFDEEEQIYEEPGLYNLFYSIIPPGYLTQKLPLGYHEFQWEISFFNSGEQQFMSFTSGFTLI